MTKTIQSLSVFIISLISLRILHINAADATIFSSGIGFLLFVSASLIEWLENLKHKLSTIDKSITELYQFKSDATQTVLRVKPSTETIDGSKQPIQTDSKPHKL
ncbi:hypothetical protein C6P12_06550 [Weissella confusa]|uniref:hypothetical protein n=1 Tax=Weissella confusa TaxID=1583 RepID=UPI00107FB2C7|nr:hypothetical protein [Weissella confusa]TGE64427.1 hypothetical protein C6P12_06550 [Weissella confusa]